MAGQIFDDLSVAAAVTIRSEVGGPSEQQNTEGDEVQSGEGGGQAFVVAGQAAEARHQAKARSTTHRRCSRTKPRLASGSSTTSMAMPWLATACAARSPV